MNNKLTKESLIFTLPRALAMDEVLAALADVDAEALLRRLEETDLPRILSNIDNMGEEVLDILARDFKVDWWDPNYSLDEKRRTVKDSWYVHKRLGTKSAVERAIRAIYPASWVDEWFEYGGKPYHFRLNVDLTGDNGERWKRRRVLERLEFYKSLRSHCEGVRYFLIPEKSWATVDGVFLGSKEECRPKVWTPELKIPGGTAEVVAGGALAGERAYQWAGVETPELKPHGGTARATAGAALAGWQHSDRVNVEAPELKPHGGTARATAGAALAGWRHSDRVSVQAPELKQHGGAAEAVTGGNRFAMVHRMTVRPRLTPPEKAGGTAEADAGGGVFRSRERRRVQVRAEPSRQGGRTGAKCHAGIYYTYQRQAVRIGT